MSTQVVALWWFGATVAVLLVPLALVLVVMWLPAPSRKRKVMLGRLLAVMMLALLSASLLALSGCGTAPSPAPTRLWVPAELLTPPAPPVLLMPGSGLRPPGPTTPPTLRLGPLTVSGISA